MEDFQKRFVLALLAYGVQRNRDPQRLCKLSGIHYKSLTQQTKKPLTAGHINSLWKNASHLSNELNGLFLDKTIPVSARFPYPAADVYDYTRVFKCPIRGKAGEISLEFPNRILSQTILSANYELQNFLLQKINVLKKKGETTLRTKVNNYLLANSYLHGNEIVRQSTGPPGTYYFTDKEAKMKCEGQPC